LHYALAIDIGGTTIKHAIVGRDGQVIFESRIPTRTSAGEDSLLNRLRLVIMEMLDHAKANSAEVIGIGIGVPSVVDNGMVLYANNLPELDNLPLDTLIKEDFQLPVFVESDGWLMGLGEARWGAARNISEAVLLTIGTGIGGALILNGRLYKGYRNRNTEPGFMIIDCSSSHDGSLEAKASVTALIKFYKSLFTDTPLPSDPIDARYIISRYHQQEPNAVAAMNDHWHHLAVGVAGLINIFAPQKCIIGGGISEAGDFYLENLAARAFSLTLKETSQFTTIERAALGNKAGFLGAAALIFDRLPPA
jgi:glucokinase